MNFKDTEHKTFYAELSKFGDNKGKGGSYWAIYIIDESEEYEWKRFVSVKTAKKLFDSGRIKATGGNFPMLVEVNFGLEKYWDYYEIPQSDARRHPLALSADRQE